MTESEAIKQMQWCIEDVGEYRENRFIPRVDALKLAIEALEKQIPKKTHYPDENGFYECGACRGIAIMQEDTTTEDNHYCPYCGNRLDWVSDEVEE